MKKKKNIYIILVMILISAILLIGLFYFRHLYLDAKEPLYGHYIDKDLRVTIVDQENQDNPYAYFFNGEYDNKEIANMINYVSKDNKINSYNEKALVTIMFEGKEYRVEKEEDYNELCNSINNKQGTYLVSCEYNADTGYVDLVKFMKSE